MPANQAPHVAAEAFQILRTLYQLSTDFFSSENRQDLVFRILNNTVRLFPYRRALLWSLNSRKPWLVGISGQEDVNQQAPLAELWVKAVSCVKDEKAVKILNGTREESEWRTLAEKTSGLSVMWVPISDNGKRRAGLWLERWGNDVWDVAEAEIMNSFAQTLTLVWKQFNPQPRWYSRGTTRLHMLATAMAVTAVAGLLYSKTIPLRVVAPCEIVPKDPVVVSAPLEGVIKQVLVQPGDYVDEGDLLFSYEDRVILQELKVAQKQVEIVNSQYDRVRLRAFEDHEAIEKIQSVKYRLEQEQIRLKLAESNARNVEVRAPTGGVCMLDNPETWRGRPVQVGERIVMLFLSEKGKVKIFLPEADYIRFNDEKPVRIVLNADPGLKYEAKLNYVSPQASKSLGGGASFVAEADLPSTNGGLRVGSKGTAIVYGEEVPMAYWLLRKPLAATRRFLGL